MNKIIQLAFGLLITISAMAQKEDSTLPYYQIPDYPAEYTANNVAARMIDGLGFRYYWATEGLRDEDLAFKPNEEARTSEETLDHILGLTNIIVNSVKKVTNIREENPPQLSYEEKRRQTLNNLKQASDILKASSDGEMKEFKLVFQSQDGSTEFPFWTNVNGPIEDAVWHVGQIVSFRRSSGNPFNSKVSVFSGKLRD